MNSKLFTFCLAAFLLSMLFSGFAIKDQPNNVDRTSPDLQQSAQDILPVSDPLNDAACTYTWATQVSGTANQLLTVYAVSDQIGWAAGVGPTVVKTVNGGTTWTSATGTGISGDVYNIYALDANTAFLTTSPGATFIYKTINGGTTWTQVFTQTGGFIDAIQMISATVGYAIGDPVGGLWTVLKTIDGGSSWNRMATEPAQVGTEAGWNNSFIIVGNHIWFGTNNTRVYHSTDLGVTWSFGTTTGTLNTYATHYNSTFEGMAGGGLTATPLTYSSNSGTTYTQTATYPGTTGNLDGLEGNGQDWWAIRSGTIVYKSVNQGATWTTDYTQAAAVWQDIDFAINGCASGWVVGNAGAIAKMSNTSTPSVLTLTINFQACNATNLISVQLRSTTAPYSLIETSAGLGGMSLPQIIPFLNTSNGVPYYIVVKYINVIETWSKSGGETFTAGTLSYDFTTSLSQAYGSNQVLVGSEASIYQGDANQDGSVTLTDVLLTYNDANAFITGPSTDFNCDATTDLTDVILAFNNAANFVQISRP